MTKRKLRVVNHTADIGIEVYGDTIEDLFLNSAEGLYEITGLQYDGEEKSLEIKIKGDEIEELLVKFLNELIYLMETKNIAGKIEKLTIEKGYILSAILKVKKIKSIGKEIKAATYHNLKIKKSGDGFKTTIIFDL